MHLCLLVARASRGVFLGRNREVERFALTVQRVELLQKRDTPLASGSRTEAVRKLARDRGVFSRSKVREFAQGHSKAQTDIIIRIHPERVVHASEKFGKAVEKPRMSEV